jgi:hypothetical protein
MGASFCFLKRNPASRPRLVLTDVAVWVARGDVAYSHAATCLNDGTAVDIAAKDLDLKGAGDALF